MNLGLCVLELRSVGRGHLLAHRVLGSDMARQKVELLDLCTLGSKSLVLLQGPSEVLKALVKDIPNRDLLRSVVVEDLNEKILPSFLSLQSAPIHNVSVIIESRFLGDLFQIANFALNGPLEIAEFRFSRVENSPGFLILTGRTGVTDSQIKPAVDLVLKSLSKDISFTRIDGVNAGYAQFFSNAILS